ncbi:RiPP maturation radical SAM C-methyltransferase [Streptomyces sp. NPDC057909]|uniref:RiPP maturation radical SAM C-methyltransferase n=1 Tax=Streptomyces sp. NPDC057909 TaxID=3346277 RepID=UPI0036EFB684
MTSPLRVLLASMPWHALDLPSLPVGILQTACVRAGRAKPSAFFGNLAWADYLHAQTEGSITPTHCQQVSELGPAQAVGDWIFAGALHDDADFGKDGFASYIEAAGLPVDRITAMRALAGGFIEQAARHIAAAAPDVVGLTSTFMQNAPSLALARQLKKIQPDVVIVMGGANCDGPMGAALHRCFPFIDYVVRGEGEEVFPQLLQALEDAGQVADIPGLCWRDSEGHHANPPAGSILPPGRIPAPAYDDWFTALRTTRTQAYVDPKLLVETSRGCWWGEAHQCTFCGLNGSLIQFRSKSPARVLEEVTDLVTRHRVLDLCMVDNIIDNTYFTTVLPRIAELGWDLRIHYEVKSNLRPEHIAALRDAGVVGVQPGIESLSTPVLKLMDKGVSALQNIRTLRDCESAHLTVLWNWLIGFPGETLAHYAPALEQLPALAHLQPPGPGANRIYLERFSPYFDRPELGFPNRRAKAFYPYLYDVPASELDELAYFFDTDPTGLDDAAAGTLSAAIDRWIGAYPASSLTRLKTADGIRITDQRTHWRPQQHHIEDPALVAAYLELEHGRSPQGLHRRLAEQGHHLPDQRLHNWLDHLADHGLVYRDHGSYLALATTSTPARITPTTAATVAALSEARP